MKTKIKIQLSELKISSFVTAIDKQIENTVKGGLYSSACTIKIKYT